MAINSEAGDWGYSEDAGERVWLLQSPNVDSIQPPNQSDDRRGGASSFGAVFIVVNAALGAGLLNFPAAFNMAGGITAGVTLQMCVGRFLVSYVSWPLLYTPFAPQWWRLTDSTSVFASTFALWCSCKFI
uniref:Amino acid transporter transmembrane domain-containing protein n=1 Tax=Sinocyclocheilus grahami TaxID=75366 RepID=A0A672T887_SINGR